MKIDWDITQSDIEKILAFSKLFESEEFVKQRIRDNVESPAPEISREIMWEGIFDCLLSSQQKSGPESHIAHFLHIKPFPLSVNACLNEKSPQNFIRQRLENHGGIRFKNNVAKYAAYNLNWLEDGGWNELEKVLLPLIQQRKKNPEPPHQKYEREVAHKLRDIFKGI